MFYADYRIEPNMNEDGSLIEFKIGEVRNMNGDKPQYFAQELSAKLTEDWDYATTFTLSVDRKGMMQLSLPYSMPMFGSGGPSRLCALLLHCHALAAYRLVDIDEEAFISAITPVMLNSYKEVDYEAQE